MEWEQTGPVDPEVRAYVYSLSSAVRPLLYPNLSRTPLICDQLGGTGADEDGRYVLGDDALACLKDLKRWLRLHDERANRLDVARCLADANLVNGDLLPILATWSETAMEDKFRSKIALACLELLVPLTWPIEKDDTQMTVNHHRHIPYLRLAQTSYKRAILEHESGLILRTCVRVALPSIALPMGERTSRDEGIIKLVLYFCRNVAMISLPDNVQIKSEQPEVSRSATIEAFHHQDVLVLLLTIASNMGEDFNTQDIVILEVLFHLLKGVDVEKLFMDREQLNDANGSELKSLLAQEAGMHRNYAKNAPSRHNRFGTMIWIQRDGEGRHSTVSGQTSLKDGQQTMNMMDKSKKWNKPKRAGKGDDQNYERFDMPVPLTESAKLHLRSFVEELLDSGFNPLFENVRKALERESERVLEVHRQQYFYLISWFLEAERARRRKKVEAARQRKDKKLEETFEADSFALIASVLIQENFVLLNRFMQDRLDMKAWRELQAGMRCFTQILLIVQDMAESPVEEDQEIAENIQNRIFYEETTHDRIITILRGYKDQGFGFLNTCTELSHVFLRMLEHYSREHVDLQIRSRRRARKTKKAEAKQRGEDSDRSEASEMEDVREAERTIKERKFDFTRFAAKFMTQACVDTFVAFTKFFNDLDVEQLKRAHRFFFRVAFKQDLAVMLFRLDIIALFNNMIKGAEGLDSKSPMFKEWDELVRQVFKKLIRKFEQRPELTIEILFSKNNSTTYFLEHGHEKQTQKATPRPPASLEVRGDMTLSEQISVTVAVLYDDHIEYIDWVIKTLSSAADERQSWEAEATARRDPFFDVEPENSGDQPGDPAANPKPPSVTVIPPNEEIRIAMFKNAHLRLLMTLCSFDRLGVDDEPGATWIIPSSISSSELRDSHFNVDKFRNRPVFTYGDDPPLQAADLLRRKPLEKARRAEYDDDSDGSLGIVSDSEEFLFPAGGPTNTADKKKDALEKLKTQRRKRHRSTDGTEITEKERERRRKAREKADLEKRRKIKSAEFVLASDEESDEERDREFFTREEAMRKGQRNRVMEALAAGRVERTVEGEKIKPKSNTSAGGVSGRKRKAAADSKRRDNKRQRASSDVSSASGDSDDDDMDVEHDLPSPGLGIRAMLASSDQSDEEEEDEEEKETPLSSPPLLPKQPKQKISVTEEERSEEGTLPPSQLETTGKIKDVGLHGEEYRGDAKKLAVPAVNVIKNRGRAVLEDSDDE